MSVTGRSEGAPEFTAQQVLRPRVQVELQIRQAILSGQFAPGDKLAPETRLAEQFGVSRPTVREALGHLVSSGLIRKIPGISGGSFVNSVTAVSLSKTLGESLDTILRLGELDVDEVTGVRRVLEIPAARMAAENRSDEHLEVLARIVDRQMTTTLDDPDIPDYDRTFHSTVAEASGNRLLGAFVSALHSATMPVKYLEITPRVAKATVKQHIAILTAVRGEDPDAAGAAMQDHLDYVLKHSTPCSWVIAS